MIEAVIQADWTELLGKLKPNSIDLIVTDPPYESLMKWKGVGTTARMGLGREGTGSDDEDKFYPTIPNEDLPDLLKELYRVLKWNCHCYVMCDGSTLHYIFDIVGDGWHESGCECRRHSFAPFSNTKVLVWDKVNMGMGYHFRARHEFIVMLDKGKNRRLNDLGISDVLTFKPPSKKAYPTQKPVELFEVLISQSSAPGEVVLDPFSGAGTTAVAAKRLGRQFVVGDISDRAIALTKESIAAVVMSPPDPED